MTCLFYDSFDSYASATDLYLRWDGPGTGSFYTSPAFLTGAATPFGTGQAFYNGPSSSVNQWSLTKTFITGTNETTVYGTFRLLAPLADQITSYNAISFNDGGVTGQQFSVEFRGDGSIALLSGGTLTGNQSLITATPGGTFHSFSWNSFQFAVTIGATGSFYLYMNGATSPIISATNINTRGHSTNNYCNSISFFTDNTSTGIQLDDILFNNGSGSAPVGLPGDVRIIQQVPASDIDTGFTPSSGTTHYNLCADAAVGYTEDGDTTYVSANAAGLEDLYGLTSLPATVTTVIGVAPFAFWRKTDAGTRSVSLQLKANGVETSATTANPGQTYNWSQEAFFGLDPSGVGWTVATANAAAVGAKILS